MSVGFEVMHSTSNIVGYYASYNFFQFYAKKHYIKRPFIQISRYNRCMTKIFKLVDIADIIPGMAFASKQNDPQGNIPVIQASAIVANEVLSDFSTSPKIENYPMRSPALVDNDDIVIVSRAMPGSNFKSSLIKTNSELVASASVYIIKLKDSTVKPEYLNYLFNSNIIQKQIQKEAMGTVIEHITRSKLGQVQLPIPNLKTQMNIIGLCSNLRKQEKVIQELLSSEQKLLNGIFNQMTTINNEQAN